MYLTNAATKSNIDLRDRPVPTSLRVSPAMLLAGELVLEQQRDCAPDYLLVEAVYRAMDLAREAESAPPGANPNLG